ncbi:hypothetical protein PS874_04192 [Pseudomonas fluorescens]|nr:hypothetical protein PS874_04192 [Pseudomonas fluorescens]
MLLCRLPSRSGWKQERCLLQRLIDTSVESLIRETCNTPQTPAPTPTAAISEVDVASKLEALASQQGGQLNWRTSIVDLLKLLNIDSSLAARKELAAELHYTGSTDDSAAMNIWLHSAVMKKLAENGGKVPADLLN